MHEKVGLLPSEAQLPAENKGEMKPWEAPKGESQKHKQGPAVQTASLSLSLMAATNPSLSVTIFFLLLGLSLSFPDGVNLKGPIKTVVVLVMENRSFDHMLGWMKRLNPKIEGVTGEECNPRSTSHPDADLICFKDGAEFVDPDPGHSYQAVKEQVFGTLNATGSNSVPSMNGFVQQAFAIGADDLPEKVMQGFGPDSISVYKTLVEEFAVFDRWFSSLPGPTQPNGMFLYSATSHGAISHVKRELAKGYPQKSIFDSIYESGLDFGVYYQSFPTTLFLRNMRRLKYVSKFHMYDLKFKRDANNGKLPNMCVIEPRYFDLKIIEANDDHPSHDVSNGQRLVKEVYETLRSSPQWNETLLIITYDEHGGFFDHVPTPTENVPSPDGNTGPPPDFFKFDRLGVRIPTLMVSPWIKKGTVVGRPNGPTKSSEYEHSSVAATIQKLFHLNSNFLTHRDAWAGTFEHILEDLQEPRTECPEVLPDVPNSLRRSEAKEDAKLSEFQSELVHLAAVLNGDRFLSRFPDDIGSRMTVKEASEYVNGAVSRFMEASKEALKLGANGSAIVDMRSSLTTRKKLP